LTRRGERGFTMIAAIMSIAVFGAIAFELLAQNRGVLAEVRGEAEQARLTAACNAGLYAAMAGLSNPDITQRWGIDGRSRQARFDDIDLNITVEDERGKIPVNGIIEEEVRDLFTSAGVSGSQLDTLVDSFEDWEDTDNTPRAQGAEGQTYAALGYKPRNGGFRTIGELRLINGMNDAIYDRIAPSLTAFFGESGGFSEIDSQPLALEVLGEVSPDSPQVKERVAILNGEITPPMSMQNVNLLGRTLTVRVTAGAHGASLTRSAIIEFTGNVADPYWFRYLD